MKDLLESLGFEDADLLAVVIEHHKLRRRLSAALVFVVLAMIFHPGITLDAGLHHMLTADAVRDVIGSFA